VIILIEGTKYFLSVPEKEKVLEDMVKEHYKEIFGEDSIYFEVKQKITSKHGVGSIPDGYVISLLKPFEWYIVEGELSIHPLHEHITDQLNRFMIGVKNPATQKELVELFYSEITKDKLKKAYVENKIGSPEIKGLLYELLQTSPKIVVVIEENGEEVQEACSQLKAEPLIVEFKTFVKEDDPTKHLHLFAPIFKTKTDGTRGEKTKEYESWNEKLARTNPNLREIALELESKIMTLGKISTLTKTRKAYAKGKYSFQSCFVILEITDKSIIARMEADPNDFKDPQNWSEGGVRNIMFFSHGSQIKITKKEQIDYAMSLIKQAFECVRTKD
jgi:predicted transport protein